MLSNNNSWHNSSTWCHLTFKVEVVISWVQDLESITLLWWDIILTLHRISLRAVYPWLLKASLSSQCQTPTRCNTWIMASNLSPSKQRIINLWIILNHQIQTRKEDKTPALAQVSNKFLEWAILLVKTLESWCMISWRKKWTTDFEDNRIIEIYCLFD